MSLPQPSHELLVSTQSLCLIPYLNPASAVASARVSNVNDKNASDIKKYGSLYVLSK